MAGARWKFSAASPTFRMGTWEAEAFLAPRAAHCTSHHLHTGSIGLSTSQQESPGLHPAVPHSGEWRQDRFAPSLRLPHCMLGLSSHRSLGSGATIELRCRNSLAAERGGDRVRLDKLGEEGNLTGRIKAHSRYKGHSRV